VLPGTPAAAAGIQKGDVIAGVDEEAASDLTLADLRDLFRQIGHQYKLVLARGGQTLQITVQMRRLL
jgi:C-terminal processing protease CtpA/Prc